MNISLSFYLIGLLHSALMTGLFFRKLYVFFSMPLLLRL